MGTTIVFCTVCTRSRERWLAAPGIHELLRRVWSQADEWLVGRYVILPDHIHLFATPNGDVDLSRWVQFWKSQFSRGHGVREHRWQTGHWDRTLRSGESYAEKWDYVKNNPVRHGLVQHANDWPFQGELVELEW